MLQEWYYSSSNADLNRATGGKYKLLLIITSYYLHIYIILLFCIYM